MYRHGLRISSKLGLFKYNKDHIKKQYFKALNLNREELEKVVITGAKSSAMNNHINQAIRWAATQDKNISIQEITEAALELAIFRAFGDDVSSTLREIISIACELYIKDH